jgi:hypothetical protein
LLAQFAGGAAAADAELNKLTTKMKNLIETPRHRNSLFDDSKS